MCFCVKCYMISIEFVFLTLENTIQTLISTTFKNEWVVLFFKNSTKKQD